MPPSRLARFLESTLRVRPNELRRAGLMALYSMFAVGAMVVGRSVRDALYLHSSPDAVRNLPWMYLLSSGAVAATSLLYSRYADRFRRDRLNASTAIIWAGILIAFRLGVASGMSWVYPTLYVAVEAMGSIVIIQFWTLASDLFHAREAKRLFGLIAGGGTLANVVFGFLIGTLSKLVGADNLLLLVAACLMACAIFSFAAGRTIPQQISRPTRRASLQMGRESVSVFKSPHLITVAGIAALSAVAVTIVDFQFKGAASVAFEKDALAGFFGRFYGVCGFAALGIQMGVTGRVLERYGILASLMPLPLGLAVGSASAIAAPGLWTSALSKGSDTIFRYTINDASMQLLYVPVPSNVRGRAKAFIDGILKPTSIAIAGLLLIGYRYTGGGHQPLTFAVLTLIAFWIFLLVRARREYIKSLVETLHKRRLDISAVPLAASDEHTARALRRSLASEDPLTVIHALELVPQIPHRDFSPQVVELLKHRSADVRAASLDHLALTGDPMWGGEVEARLEDPDPQVRSAAIGAYCAVLREKAIARVVPFLEDRSPAIRSAAIVGLVRHCGLDGILTAAESLKALIAARETLERELCAQVLGAIGVRTFYAPLVRLLDDDDDDVRRAALNAAARLRSPELVPALIDSLKRRDTARDSALALAALGAGIEPQLANALDAVSTTVEVRRNLPMVLGRLATPTAVDLLHRALQQDDSVARERAARALGRALRRRSDLRADRTSLNAAVHRELELAEFCQSAAKALGLFGLGITPPNTVGTQLLSMALLEERDRAVDRSLIVLDILMPGSGFELVADNLKADSLAQKNNAIEVLDNALPDTLKRRFLPLIEAGKHKLPEERQERGREGWLAELMRRCGPWIGSCAVHLAGEEQHRGLLNEVMNALTSSAPVMRETAVRALARLVSGPALVQTVTPALEDPHRAVRACAKAVIAAAVASRSEDAPSRVVKEARSRR